MSLLQIARNRFSARGYQDKKLEKEKLLQVLEAARLAPSAVNFQPIHFYVLTKEEDKQKIAETYPRDWFVEAPVVIVACADHSKSWKRKDGKDHADIDVAIAVDHMTLAATDLGLGTCWICAFDAKRCHEILHLPEHMEVVALMPLGYPKSGRASEMKRNNLEEIITWGI